ncbi:MAG: GAF domain-containing protein [Limnothrix sp. RL_2_0]|nr:GAF domain-containing protein [Limnothrix sp. RL_2_0]
MENQPLLFVDNPLSDPFNVLDREDSSLSWQDLLNNHSKLLMAILEPKTFLLKRINHAFEELTGINSQSVPIHHQNISLFDLLADVESSFPDQLYRRHLLPLVLRDVYGLSHNRWRFLDEPLVATFHSSFTTEPRHIQFWLRSQHLHVQRINPEFDEFADFKLHDIDPENLVLHPEWEQRLNLDNYQVTGQWLWEGLDVTNRELLQRLIGSLVDRESIFEEQKFQGLTQQMKSLFRSHGGILLSVQHEKIQLYRVKNHQIKQTTIASLDALESSHFLRAASRNDVLNIPDLQQDCPTNFERKLVSQGTRSMLLIPLVLEYQQDNVGSPSSQLMGMVAMLSDRRNNFDHLDISHGKKLIPALRTALRTANQLPFNSIHPAVEWRFREEAERRSWGLAPAPIIFEKVYPIYGISDIRGSSEERNHSVQKDLLEQYGLAIAVIQAVIKHQEIPFLQQLQLNLEEKSHRLASEVHVEDEVTAIEYLRQHLEIYFDYFQTLDEPIAQAIAHYRAACDNPHGSACTAREHYDYMILDITTRLRATWDRWQKKMQAIIPHYCDVEVTDGIDHMIYCGKSIHHKFSPFQLHALRYEQIRAVCDCARTCLNLKNDYDTTIEVTHLVLVQDITIDIYHDEQTEKNFDVRGSRDTRYEIVKKRIDKGRDLHTKNRITQPGMVTIVYSSDDELHEYRQYVYYLQREGWLDSTLESGTVEPLQGVTGLKFARIRVLPESPPTKIPMETIDQS